MKKLIIALTLSLFVASPVFAAATVDTTVVYNSGFLVLTFLGFCAMIVIAKLIPAISLLVGSVRSAAQSLSAGKEKASLGI